MEYKGREVLNIPDGNWGRKVIYADTKEPIYNYTERELTEEEKQWQIKYLPKFLKYFGEDYFEEGEDISYFFEEWMLYQLSTSLFDAGLDYDNDKHTQEVITELKTIFPEYYDTVLEMYRNGEHDT
jgi:hypothetical protein